jgi:hypothetical protein
LIITILCPKLSNPDETVEVIHEDEGLMKCWDKEKNEFESYVTRLQFRQKDGSYIKHSIIVSKDAGALEHINNFRLVLDVKYLASCDIDLISGVDRKWQGGGFGEGIKKIMKEFSEKEAV